MPYKWSVLMQVKAVYHKTRSLSSPHPRERPKPPIRLHYTSLCYRILWELDENVHTKHTNLVEMHIYIQQSRRDQALCLHLVEICAIITQYHTISTSYVRRLRSRLYIQQRLLTRSRRLYTRSRRGVHTRRARLRIACISSLCMI